MGSAAVVQETLVALLYKDSRFQFSRLESLLSQASRAPGRSELSRADADAARQGSGLELLLSPGVAFVRPCTGPPDCSSIYRPDFTCARPVMLLAMLASVCVLSPCQLLCSADTIDRFSHDRQVRDLLLEELAKGIDSAWRLAFDDAVAAARKRLQETLAVRTHQIAL